MCLSLNFLYEHPNDVLCSQIANSHFQSQAVSHFNRLETKRVPKCMKIVKVNLVSIEEQDSKIR